MQIAQTFLLVLVVKLPVSKYHCFASFLGGNVSHLIYFNQ